MFLGSVGAQGGMLLERMHQLERELGIPSTRNQEDRQPVQCREKGGKRSWNRLMFLLFLRCSAIISANHCEYGRVEGTRTYGLCRDRATMRCN